jgi:transposase-like protein
MKATMASIGEGSETSNIRDEIRIDEGGIRKHLDRLVKASAEEIQNNTWTRLRTNNALERMNREIRKRTRVVGHFPDGRSALLLVLARLRPLAGTQWGARRYLVMDKLQNQSPRKEALEVVGAG